MLEHISPDFSHSFEFLEETDENRKDRISRPEILSVWKGFRVIYSLHEYSGFHYYIIGFGNRKRPLKIIFAVDDDIVYFLKADVATEDEIIRDYCTKC